MASEFWEIDFYRAEDGSFPVQECWTVCQRAFEAR